MRNTALLIKLLLPVLLVFPLLSFVSSNTDNNSNEIEWLTLEEAYKRNQKEPRKIFVDVYTDWCGWCKKMDRDTFQDADVATYVNDNYYAIKLDAESKTAHKLGEATITESQAASQWGVRGFPTIVLMEKDFKTILPVSGYKKPDEFLKLLKGFSTSQNN